MISGKSEVTGLTKEVEEQSTMRIVGGNFLHYSSVPPSPPGMDCSQPCTLIERVDAPLQTSRQEESNPWEHVPSTSTALSDTRSVADKSASKRKEKRNLNFEPSAGTI